MQGYIANNRTLRWPVKTAKPIGSAPILLVADVVKSANYYRDTLGFTYDKF